MNMLRNGSPRCTTFLLKPPVTVTGDTWVKKNFNNAPKDFHEGEVWTDGTNVYFSRMADWFEQYVLNGDTWVEKTWDGFTPERGSEIWTDGESIYYSRGSDQYVLNGDTWEPKTWSGLTHFWGSHVWTDGSTIYYSSFEEQYVLNGDTWEPNTWEVVTEPYAEYIWSDGANIYYSRGSDQYVLNGDTWEPKTWNGFARLVGDQIWSDGSNIYYLDSHDAYVDHYVLHGDTWELKTWKGISFEQSENLSDVFVPKVWTDGTDIYLSKLYPLRFDATEHYVLTNAAAPTYDPEALLQGYLVGCRLRAMRGKKKPIAYLYNGVRLPKLPETDLPYASIHRSSGGEYWALFSSSPWEYNTARDMFISQVYPVSGSFWECGGDFSTWKSHGGVTNSNGGILSFGTMGADAWYWTNADIPTTDGSPFLAASEPVPVYA